MGIIRARRVAPLFMLGTLLVGTVKPAEAHPLPVVNPSPDPTLPAAIQSNWEYSGDSYEHPQHGHNPHPVVRDVGMSVPLPAVAGQPSRSMWIFGDGGQAVPDGTPDGAPGFPVPGTSAAIGPYTPGRAPIHLSTATKPGTAMPYPNNLSFAQQFLDNPTDMKNPQGTACQLGQGDTGLWPAAWPFGATRGPNQTITLRNERGAGGTTTRNASSLVFISYFDVCLYSAPHTTPPTLSSCSESKNWVDYSKDHPNGTLLWTFQRLNLAAYDPISHQIVATMTVFETNDGSCLPWQKILVQPVFTNTHLYMYAIDCSQYESFFTACISGKVTAARVALNDMWDGNQYRWASAVSPATGVTAWSANHTTAVSVTPNHGLGPLMLDVHNFGSAAGSPTTYLMMEQTSWGSHYDIYQAPSPTGPWTARSSGRFSEPRCDPDNQGFCYNLYGHPELSTPGHLVYSYYPRTDVNTPDDDVITVVDLGSAT